MRPTHVMALAMLASAYYPAPSDRMELDPDAFRKRHVGPPLSWSSGARMSAADVTRMSQRRSRQRAAGKRRSR